MPAFEIIKPRQHIKVSDRRCHTPDYVATMNARYDRGEHGKRLAVIYASDEDAALNLYAREQGYTSAAAILATETILAVEFDDLEEDLYMQETAEIAGLAYD